MINQSVENGVLMRKIEKNYQKKLICLKIFYQLELNILKFKKLIDQKFSSHPGNTKDFWACTTRNDVIKKLDYFIKEKLENFGDYEDAVDKKDNILFHSALSPYINIGLITPQEILSKIKKSYKKLNSLEGYIRQLIGWREFMRGIYQNFDKELENKIFLITIEK